MVAPTGESVVVDPKHLIPLLLNGFKFEDSHYQNLIEAEMKIHRSGDAGESINAAMISWMNVFGGLGKWVLNRNIADKDRDLTYKSFDIAQALASEQNLHKVAEYVGTGIGIMLVLMGVRVFAPFAVVMIANVVFL